jgi:hypothetical protein
MKMDQNKSQFVIAKVLKIEDDGKMIEVNVMATEPIGSISDPRPTVRSVPGAVAISRSAFRW